MPLFLLNFHNTHYIVQSQYSFHNLVMHLKFYRLILLEIEHKIQIIFNL